MAQSRVYDIAAYIWPSYHYEPLVEHFWPEKDGEWYTVRRGRPRFPGHAMPRVPLLGYQDEADPAVMRQHVQLAANHGVNTFIVDWYWYQNAPCFERQLNEGLIPALRGTDSRFYLMWANHDVDTLWNMHTDTGGGHPSPVLWPGTVTRDELEPMFDRIIDTYFTLDSYYRIDNKPVFSIFSYPNFVRGLGSLDAVADACDWMRERTARRGFAGLHLQAITWGFGRVEAGDGSGHVSTEQVAAAIRFDSATPYQFVMDSGSTGQYHEWAERAINKWGRYEQLYGTFYPHVSIGWDNTHRNPSAGIEQVVSGSSPAAFESCLRRAKAYADARPQQVPLITVNSWNEWTEGSYLLPDTEWGYGFLEAVRRVFVEGAT
jgi:hypothetical protein